MADYYLDIETYSPTKPIDFHKDPIISIAYQQIDSRSGETKSDLTILKSWETSEQDILKRFYEIFDINNRWAFIPVGCKLVDFDLIMLAIHWNKLGYKVNGSALYNHPHIDIFPALLLCNGGIFKGCSLERLAGKQGSGGMVADWYVSKDYKALEGYIQGETASFLRLYSFLVNRMPSVWAEYGKEHDIIT